MKRTLAILLSLVLLISCLPLTVSAAKELSVEDKFKLLLSDMELDPTLHQQEHYYFSTLESTDAWVLLRGGLRDMTASDSDYRYHHAQLGNKLIWANVTSAPFKTGYGVYDTKSGAFYDLADAWSKDFDGLHDAWNSLRADKGAISECGTQVIGDADNDGELTVLDATKMQRMVADLDENGFAVLSEKDFFFGYPIQSAIDYDRDADFTVMDATKLQRTIAELPNQIDYKLAWNERYTPHYDDKEHQTKYLINSLKELDLSDSRWKNDADLDAEGKIRSAYKDDFFKNKSLLLLDVSLSSGSYALTLKNVSIDKDGVLNVDFTRNAPHVIDNVINDRFICIELSKAFLDDVRDIKVNITPIREKHYDYSMVWDKRDSKYTGKGDSEMITEYSQLDPSNTYHKALISQLSDGNSYPQDYFREYAYLLINMPIGSTSYTIEGVELEIVDEILNVNVIAEGPEIGNAVLNTRFICVELSKDWLADSKDYKVNLNYEFTDQPSTKMIVNKFEYGQAVERPRDAAAAGYTMIDSESITRSEHTYYSSSVFDEIVGTEYGSIGFLAVIKSPEELRYLYPNFNTTTVYNEAFFKENALVALGFRLGGTDYRMSLSHLAVKGDTLYGEMQVIYPQACSAIYDDYTDIHKVKRSDIEKVKHTALWNDPSYTHSYAYAGYNYGESIPILDFDLAEKGFAAIDYERVDLSLPKDLASPLAKSDILNIVDKLGAIAYNPEQLDYIVKNLNQSGTIPQEDFYDYAYFVLFYSQTGERVSVRDIYSNGKTINVTLNVTKDSAVTQPTVEVWRIKKSDIANAGGLSLYRLAEPQNYLFYSYPDNQDIPTFTYFDDPEEYQRLDTKSEYQKADVIPAAEAKGRFEDSRWMALINNADQWHSLLPDLPLPTRPVVYLNGELQPSEDSENPFDDYAFLVLDYLHPYKTGEITDVYSNGKSLEVLIREDMIAGGSENYVWHKRDILKIKKSELAGIESLRFLEKDIIIDGHVYNEITPYSERSSKPANLSGYTKLSATALTKNIPGKYDYSWHSFPSTWVGASDTGYTFLITNTAVLKDFMPNADTKVYNDDYFRRYALIATVMQGYDDSATVTVGNVMKKDATLYLSPGVSYHYEYDEYGTPIASPTAPLVWKVLQVKRADVDDITDIKFWK